MRLVWSDEFETPGLPDATKWAHDTARNRDGWFNNELQYYADRRPENARVENGRLVITARQERLSSAPDFGSQNYTSARLITQGLASWTYGHFEVRAKLPCGLGTWPAIWMLGTGGRWPDDGEIDIMEQRGTSALAKREVLGTLHTRAYNWSGGTLGVAKGATRKAGFETLYLNDAAHEFTLKGDSPALHLIQQIRDEAHRFAITGHRGRRQKARDTSTLERIEGIGAKRRAKLLKHFGGLSGLKGAGVEEIARVDGINRALAERIYAQLHGIDRVSG